ncbi:uncharacterized protein BCN122_III0424 [Burkholderia cenocepacia]|nr:uncharacterized protein BCN122_III0424 [Burkholderia cenocepacia]
MPDECGAQLAFEFSGVICDEAGDGNWHMRSMTNPLDARPIRR